MNVKHFRCLSRHRNGLRIPSCGAVSMPRRHLSSLPFLGLQVYEDTAGLTVGDGVERTGKPLSVELVLAC